MEVPKPRIRLVIKKPSLPKDTNNIIHEIVRDKKINKRKASDREKMWSWMLNSDQDQNQKADEQLCSKSKIVKDAETEEMFDRFKRRKKETSTFEEIALLVEKVMALMEIAAEEDIELNRQNKPAIRKIQMLPLLTDYLSKKHLQQEFLDHGVLNLFKNWLELLPDGSLPNMTIRSSLLNILTHVLPVDISFEDQRDQLKKSGIGKVIMFLSKTDEELTANPKTCKGFGRKLESNHIPQECKVFRLRRNKEEDGEILSMKPSVILKKSSVVNQKASSVVKQSITMEDDLDLELHSKAQSARPSGNSVSVPETTPFVYELKPPSNYSVESAIARNQYTFDRNEKCHKTIETKLRLLKSSKKSSLQAAKPAVRLMAL